MKIAIFLAVCIGVTMANPQMEAGLLQRQEKRDDVGQFAFSFLTQNSAQVAQGAFKPNAAKNGNLFVQRGAYAFRTPDGKEYKVMYTADENGFQAMGDHLPVSPK